MKVLIAEEQDEFAEILKGLLEKNRFLVDAVHRGEDVFGAVLNSEYDVIVLNALLPEIDGIEILEQLRRLKITTPVLLFKSGADIEDCLLYTSPSPRDS